MKIIRCKTNHLENPLGYDFSDLVLSWSVDDTLSSVQEEARLLVSLDPDGNEIVFDSGMDPNLDNRGVHMDIDLSPYTRYYWTVEVVGNEDKAISEVNWFETGKMKDEWTGGWLTTPWGDPSISPYIRKKLELSKEIEKARVYMTGFGLYHLEINGKKVGSELFAPYCNAYDAWVQYQSYDVTDYLVQGQNVVGLLLGNGWAKGPFGTFGDMNTPYVKDFMVLGELHITYSDGTSEVIGTDESWKCHRSPIIEDSIYDGEVMDGSLIIEDWSKPSLNDENWEPMTYIKPQGIGSVTERLSPPVIIKETLKPIELIKTPAGEWVLDFGQNMVGWVAFNGQVAHQGKVLLQYGEVLQQGNFYRDNLREAKARFEYIWADQESASRPEASSLVNGDESNAMTKVIRPNFTFYGFRYVKLEGFLEPINLDDFIGEVVYTDLETTGHIETSNKLVNQLFSNAMWSQKDNFLDVPTDCPQRDERMGWTGDAQVFSGTATFNMDTYPFYVKFMKDLYEEQKFAGGMVASTVPTFSQMKHDESSFIAGGACAWSDAATVIPWEVYLHSGDPAILRRQYQSMKDWVDWVIKKDIAGGDRKLWIGGFQFGDWLALDGPVEGGVMGGTDNDFLASAYYKYSLELVAKAAKVLGLNEEQAYYQNRANDVKKAIGKEFFSATGRSTIHTQTAHVVALHFDLVDDQVKGRVAGDLVELMKKTDMHLTTGFIGTPYLCRALSDHGASDAAYEVFFQDNFPGWLNEIRLGATTIWERWNSILEDGSISGTGMNSLNHYAYGSIVEWMYRHVCGIKPLEDSPGFKKFLIQPELNGHLDHAKVELMTPMGKLISKWSLEEEGYLNMTIEIPFNAEARLILDKTDQAIDRILSAGHYELRYPLKESMELTYNLDSPLWVLKRNPQTLEVLRKYFPHFIEANSKEIGFVLPYSVGEVVKGDDGFLKGMMLRGADLAAFEEELSGIDFVVPEI